MIYFMKNYSKNMVVVICCENEVKFKCFLLVIKCVFVLIVLFFCWDSVGRFLVEKWKVSKKGW